MKYAVLIGIAVISGMFGSYLFQQNDSFGAVAARTTITSPWTFTATTTTANLTTGTSNTATTSVQTGCIQWYATSTATAHHMAIANTGNSTTTFDGSNSNFFVVDRYGNCPRL